jgi:hypothetical protein
MEKSSKRGKIPQTDWPLIMARYEAGETLASIARTYDCSPPAISYIVSRNRDQPANEPSTPPVTETQLVKLPSNGAAPAAVEANEPVVAPPPAAAIRRDPAAEARLNGANGDHRPKLHLSLGNGTVGRPVTNGNGNGHAAGALPPAERAAVAPPPAPAGERNGQPAAHNPPPFAAGRNGHDVAAPETHPAHQQPRDADMPRKDSTAFIDRELRTRVDGDIAAFLAAFDAALAEDTQASRFGLREATQRLLRAGARTRIELERLEARVPLPARDGAAQPEQAAWRYR